VKRTAGPVLWHCDRARCYAGRVPRVVFTSNLQRHVECPETRVAALTVRAALEEAFTRQPRVRDYVLDEQGHVRKHVFIFVDGERMRDRERLDAALRDASEIYVMQALTGG
jgi:molybdopterin synthase sulfur carrier subunit